MEDMDKDGEKGQKLRVLVELPHFLQVSGKVGPTAGGAQVSVEHKDYYNRSLSRLAHAKNKIKYEVLILYFIKISDLLWNENARIIVECRKA